MTDKPELSDRNPGFSSENADHDAIVRAMAAGVAHEFNNLLGAILVSAEEALESSDELELRRALRLIVSRVDQACAVTANLLSFACQDFIEPRSIDLAALLDDALSVMAEPLRSAHVTVVKDFQPLPSVNLDPSRMERVFLNLIANAVEAMPETGGRLTVSLNAEPGWAVLRFSDTGQGVPRRLLPHVFDPFITSRGVIAGGDTSNLGLGLAVCQGIVRMHGGSISLDCPATGGTVVTLSIPLQPPSNARSAPP